MNKSFSDAAISICYPNSVVFGWLPDIAHLGGDSYQIKHFSDSGVIESIEDVKANSHQEAIELIASTFDEADDPEAAEACRQAYVGGWTDC